MFLLIIRLPCYYSKLVNILTCTYVFSLSGVSMVAGDTGWRGVTVTNLAGVRHGDGEELLAAVPFGIGVVIGVTGGANNPTFTDSVDCSSWSPWMNMADGTDESPAGDVRRLTYESTIWMGALEECNGCWLRTCKRSTPIIKHVLLPESSKCTHAHQLPACMH